MVDARNIQLGKQLSTLAALTTLFYAISAATLASGSIWYVEGKNPRWVLASFGVVAAYFALHALVRGKRFTKFEATLMLTAHVCVAVGLSAATTLDLGSLSNGLVFPILGVYVAWLLPRYAVSILYAGTGAWAGAVVVRGDSMLTTMALLVVVETVVATEVVTRLASRIRELMFADPLTHALNRAGIQRQLDRHHDLFTRAGTPFSVAMIDLDGLREINNSQGHIAGDALLRQAVTEWHACLAPTEFLGRLGGDEFVVVFAGATLDQATTRMDAFKAASTVTWSSGLATAQAEESLERLMERADAQMYSSKSTKPPRPQISI